MRSAYVDKVRISWVCTTENSTGENNGLLFVASHDSALDSSTPANNDGQVIAATAGRGSGGVNTLDIRRRITIDYDGSSADTLQLLQGTSGAPVFLHVHKATTGQAQDYYLVIETWGRWFTADSL